MEKRKVKVLNTKSPKFKKHKLRLLLKPHMNCWKSLHLGRNLIPCSCQIQIETENYIELLSSFKKQIYLKGMAELGVPTGGTQVLPSFGDFKSKKWKMTIFLQKLNFCYLVGYPYLKLASALSDRKGQLPAFSTYNYKQ